MWGRCYAKEEVAHDAAFFHVNQDDSYEECRIDEVGDFKRETEAHDPRCHGGTDVSTHDDADGLEECQQSCVDKRYRHQCGGCGALHGRCDKYTRQCPGEPVCCHGSKDMSQLWASHFLEALAHGFHTEHQECERSEQFENNPD